MFTLACSADVTFLTTVVANGIPVTAVACIGQLHVLVVVRSLAEPQLFRVYPWHRLHSSCGFFASGSAWEAEPWSSYTLFSAASKVSANS